MPRMKPIEPYYTYAKDAKRILRKKDIPALEREAINKFYNRVDQIAHNRMSDDEAKAELVVAIAEWDARKRP